MLDNGSDLIDFEAAHSNAVLKRNHGISSTLIFLKIISPIERSTLIEINHALRD